MNSISKEWLVGFIEGEGNFNVSLSKSHKKYHPNYSFEYYPILQFRIFLREDDLSVLEKIRSTLSIGNIYKKSYAYSRKKGINSRDQYAFYITGLKDLFKLKEFLSSCEFHTKKKKDMEKFFKILELKAENKHLTPEGYLQVISLANSMNSQARTNFRVKQANEHL